MTDNPPTLRPGPKDAITDIAGIRVGHWTNRRAATGCTVILCETSKFAAVDIRGGAPATRETDVLGVTNVVKRCDAVVLTGGSAFGLSVADGVARYLAENNVGFETAAGNVPIVSAASIFDLGLGNGRVRPDAEAGYRVAVRAKAGAVKQGSVGGGTGATVAKLLGSKKRLKGGLGTASLVTGNGLAVGAVAVTNPVGSIVDPAGGALVAGPRGEPGEFVATDEAALGHATARQDFRGNTTLICVATNATLDHVQTHRLAMLSHDGMARAITPAHTMGDGDLAFAISMGTAEVEPEDMLLLGHMTARVVSQAILNSVREATGLAGTPSADEWLRDRHP